MMLLYLCGGDVGVTKGHLHCENPPWMILIMNPAPLKVTFVISFFFFLMLPMQRVVLILPSASHSWAASFRSQRH